jgi:NAD(P)H dehydrogenase (quinone)
MRVMVVYAHPLDDSFNAALHRTVVNALRESGHEVDDCDLYAENFNPVMSAEERRHYHDETRNRAPVSAMSSGCLRRRPWCCVTRPGHSGRPRS